MRLWFFGFLAVWAFAMALTVGLWLDQGCDSRDRNTINYTWPRSCGAYGGMPR
jgi:hypothetical protein